MKNIRKEKGITLIALVITIIVLLILAGVAISMLSGENGILTKASEAKEKTEEAQKEEAGALLSYELVLNNSKYKYQYGYLTGFEYVKNEGQTVETVEDLENALPSGYKVTSRYQFKDVDGVYVKTAEIEDVKIDDKTINIATGMAITKDGEEVARTVLFGDVNMDGIINLTDSNMLKSYLNFNKIAPNGIIESCQKIAGNVVYNDKELDLLDVDVIKKYFNGGSEINQNITIYQEKTKRMYTEIQEYINLLDKTTGYTFEYNEEDDTYTLKGVKKGTTVKELVEKLPNSDKVTVEYIESSKAETMSDDDELKENCYIKVEIQCNDLDGNEQTLKSSFAYIELV